MYVKLNYHFNMAFAGVIFLAINEMDTIWTIKGCYRIVAVHDTVLMCYWVV